MSLLLLHIILLYYQFIFRLKLSYVWSAALIKSLFYFTAILLFIRFIWYTLNICTDKSIWMVDELYVKNRVTSLMHNMLVTWSCLMHHMLVTWSCLMHNICYLGFLHFYQYKCFVFRAYLTQLFLYINVSSWCTL